MFYPEDRADAISISFCGVDDLPTQSWYSSEGMNRKHIIAVIENFRQGRMLMDSDEVWTDGHYIYSYALRIAWKEDDVIMLLRSSGNCSWRTKKHIDVCAAILKTIERK